MNRAAEFIDRQMRIYFGETDNDLSPHMTTVKKI